MNVTQIDINDINIYLDKGSYLLIVYNKSYSVIHKQGEKILDFHTLLEVDLSRITVINAYIVLSEIPLNVCEPNSIESFFHSYSVAKFEKIKLPN